MRSERQEALRKRSGAINTNDPMFEFFYLLMRDHLTPGTVAGIINQLSDPGITAEFCNGWLAQYAMDVVAELRNEP